MVRIREHNRTNDLWHDSGIRKLLLALIAFIMTMAIAQAFPVEEWNKTFGGKESDYARSVQLTSDGGYILVGYTESYGAGGSDAWLIKTNSNGNLQWQKTFGGPGDDYANSLQPTSDGGYVLAGSSYSNGSGYQKVWIIKTDLNGNLQWQKTFGDDGDEGDERAYSVQQTSDGGYILAGVNEQLLGGLNEDALLIKTDSNGNQQWKTILGGEYYDNTSSIRQTSDGGYILVGYTESYGAGGSDAWLIKTNSNGDQQWQKTFGGSGADYAYSLQPTSDGGYILSGSSYSNGSGYQKVWLIKTDINGNLQWDKTFGDDGDEGDECAYSMQQTSDGGYILAGVNEQLLGGLNEDALLIKTDSNGNQQWKTILGGEYYDNTYSIQKTSDGGYVLAGYTESYGVGSSDAWLIKIRDWDWNPWNDPDSLGGESIVLSELMTAIYDWRFGVTLSTGEKVNLSRLQQLIYDWRFA